MLAIGTLLGVFSIYHYQQRGMVNGRLAGITAETGLSMLIRGNCITRKVPEGIMDETTSNIQNVGRSWLQNFNTTTRLEGNRAYKY